MVCKASNFLGINKTYLYHSFHFRSSNCVIGCKLRCTPIGSKEVIRIEIYTKKKSIEQKYGAVLGQESKGIVWKEPSHTRFTLENRRW